MFEVVPWVLIATLAIATIIVLFFISCMSVKVYKLWRNRRRRNRYSDEWGSNMRMPERRFNRQAKDINVLFLGERSVGKSTLINSIANFVIYNNFEEVRANEARVVIPAKFVSYTEDYEPVEDTKSISKNTITDSGKTNKGEIFAPVVSYCFEYRNEEYSCKLCIVDTPGIGDLEGIVNYPLPAILSSILERYYLDAICICMKPDESVLNDQFSYILDELLSCLHASAIQSLIFCFTNTRGESIHDLKTVHTLRKFFDNRSIEITLDHTNLFSFENVAFEYLCLKKKYSDEVVNKYRILWDYSMHQFHLMIAAIKSQKVCPHEIMKTSQLNEVRSAVSNYHSALLEECEQEAVISLTFFHEEVDEAGKQPHSTDKLLQEHRRTSSYEQIKILPKFHKLVEFVTATRNFIEANAILPYNRTANFYYLMMAEHGDARTNLDPKKKEILKKLISENIFIQSLHGQKFADELSNYEKAASSKEVQVNVTAQEVFSIIEDVRQLLYGKLAPESAGTITKLKMDKVYIREK